MNDDTLIRYYYDDAELSQADRKALETDLQNDAELQERYTTLKLELDALKSAPPAKLSSDRLARFHATIDYAATIERQHPAEPKRSSFHFLSFAWGSAVSLVLVAGVVIGLLIADRSPQPATGAAATVADSSGAFNRGLQVHLARSNQTLAGLDPTGAAEREMMIRHIIQQNRFFEQAAESNGSNNLARVLRAIEPVLIELAREDLSEQEAAALQSKVQFELHVVLTKLKNKSSQQEETI
ncbi:MAG: hypothetical protein AAFR07_15465 [Pseudomonadota bacterium]